MMFKCFFIVDSSLLVVCRSFRFISPHLFRMASTQPDLASATTLTSSTEQTFPVYDYPLKFTIIKECSVSKARLSELVLPHATLQTPQFMPVGTQGALKGVLPDQIKALDCNLILGNTYHLGNRPVSFSLIVSIHSYYLILVIGHEMFDY